VTNGQHTVTVSDGIWEWARRRCSPSQGPATYLRNILIAVVAGEEPHHQSQSQPQPRPSDERRERRGGKGVHAECYNAMVADFLASHPGEEPPDATPWDAERSTICPRCYRVIDPGDRIVITGMEDW